MRNYPRSEENDWKEKQLQCVLVDTLLGEFHCAWKPEDGRVDVQAVGSVDARIEPNASAKEAAQFDTQNNERLMPFENKCDRREIGANPVVHHNAWERVYPPVERSDWPKTAPWVAKPQSANNDTFSEAKTSRRQPILVWKSDRRIWNQWSAWPWPQSPTKQLKTQQARGGSHSATGSPSRPVLAELLETKRRVCHLQCRRLPEVSVSEILTLGVHGLPI